jgi:putative DNA primase/helicase
MLMTDPFAPLGSDDAKGSARKDDWLPVLPAPHDAPPPPTSHPKLGTPTARWTYRDKAGALLGFVLRFDGQDDKVIRPLVLHQRGSKREWRWTSWPAPRPLYGLDRLAGKTSALVVITEGEKAADAAARLIPGAAVLTSPNGSKSASHADWTPLRGRSVVIWPDADAAGLDYANTVARLADQAGAASVAFVSSPAGVSVGWDAADAETEGWTAERAAALIRTAKPAGEAAANSSADSRKRMPQRDTLIGLTELCDLWHDSYRTAFVTFPVNGHYQNWPVRSREFRMWLSGRFFEETGAAIGGQALEDGVRILEARAVNDGPEYVPATRIGRSRERLYLDIGDATWRAVEIDANGWRLVERPPLKLVRSVAMRPLPVPEAGGTIEELRQFLNVRDEASFMLVVGWLVAALRERGPYPVLVVNGEQGTGKSVFTRNMRALIDPSAAPIRAVPKDDRDLVVSAGNSWILAFDNLSSVPIWLADALCRLATGGGFATRMLHTDRDESIFEASRPIILNGIPSLTDRADLADRAVCIHLAAIPEDQRQPEDELAALFETKRPLILGALLDAVSAALRNIGSVRLDRSPRMADFVKWIAAAAPGLGWDDPAEFLNVYAENRRDVTDATFEADPVAVAIREFILLAHPRDGWSGTATELLAALSERVSDGVRRSKIWPMSAQALGNRIDRIAPLLRGKGFMIERRHSGVRTITIMPPL